MTSFNGGTTDGKTYSIPELFCTTSRNFLVRNNGDQVEASSLKGKTVGIFFLKLRKKKFLPARGTTHFLSYGLHLIDAYTELLPTGNFEVVFVAIFNGSELEDEEEKGAKLFNQAFLSMPWLAVPFCDVKTRNHLKELFIRGRFYEECIILDPNGRVLTSSECKLKNYGADYYPFTPQRVRELGEQDARARFAPMPSLQSLLISSDRDYVISNNGDKVCISQLEGKVVGLYMYGVGVSIRYFHRLKQIYNELKARGSNFEIVFVNVHFEEYGFHDEQSFEVNFRGMPWLALPFQDRRCRKLWRRFSLEDRVFVTISADGKSIDEYAGDIIMSGCGVEAYPFTRDKAFQCETTRVRADTLEQIVRSDGRCHHLVIKDRAADQVREIPLDYLSGKTILLLVGGQSCPRSDAYFVGLGMRYDDIMGLGLAFEVVFLPVRGCDEAWFNECLERNPWPAFAFDDGYLYSKLKSHFKFHYGPSLLAFGLDGRLRTYEAASMFGLYGVRAAAKKLMTYNDLFDEVRINLSWTREWPKHHAQDWYWYSTRTMDYGPQSLPTSN